MEKQRNLRRVEFCKNSIELGLELVRIALIEDEFAIGKFLKRLGLQDFGLTDRIVRQLDPDPAQVMISKAIDDLAIDLWLKFEAAIASMRIGQTGRSKPAGCRLR